MTVVVEQLLTSEGLLALLGRMTEFRRFEELLAEEARTGRIHGELHLAIGQEAVPAVLERHLVAGDALVSTHRAHLHALAMQVDPVLLMGEVLERDGLNHGKGGHLHLFDPAHRFMCSGIVGASAPAALGYALAQQIRGERGITVCALGDAAMNQGAVLEAFNLAAVRALPVLFLVENNEFGISVPLSSSTAGTLAKRGAAFGIPGFACDGRDVDELDRTVAAAVRIVRDERRPALVVAEVTRFRGHYEGDADTYRTADQRGGAGSILDPIPRLTARLAALGSVTEAMIGATMEESAQRVQGWFERARALPWPDGDTATAGTFVDE